MCPMMVTIFLVIQRNIYFKFKFQELALISIVPDHLYIHIYRYIFQISAIITVYSHNSYNSRYIFQISAIITVYSHNSYNSRLFSLHT